jgi:aminoglycoside 3-N-acetyltransferase
MSEAEVIAATTTPATVETLVRDLRALALEHGATVMVHTSMSKLGFVVGGAQAVVEALVEAVGPTGTIAMPTHSGGLSDPGGWSNPPVPPDWHDTIRSTMPPFHPALTPTRSMGAVAECFRHLEGAHRSNHPSVSTAARGPQASFITHDHQLDSGLGEGSPLARLYDLDARVLLLGVTHANNTCLHLAEHRAAYPSKSLTQKSAPLVVDGRRQWVTYEDLDEDADDFDEIGESIAAADLERRGPVGAGEARLVRVRDAVDHATVWMGTNRRRDGQPGMSSAASRDGG